jgi:hypothetical protein
LQATAPFLRASQWQVEVRHFSEQLTRAALKWRDDLVQLDADILANEAWLQGPGSSRAQASPSSRRCSLTACAASALAIAIGAR